MLEEEEDLTEEDLAKAKQQDSGLPGLLALPEDDTGLFAYMLVLVVTSNGSLSKPQFQDMLPDLSRMCQILRLLWTLMAQRALGRH